MDISLGICFPEVKFCIVDHMIPLEGSMYQIFDLGLSFFVLLKKRVTFGNFLNLFFLNCIK